MNKYFDDEIKEEIIEEIRPIIRDFINSSIKYKDILFYDINFDYKKTLKLKKL